MNDGIILFVYFTNAVLLGIAGWHDFQSRSVSLGLLLALNCLNAIKPVPVPTPGGIRGIKEKYLSCKPPERSETHHFRRFGGFRGAKVVYKKA
jgi:hypothetical protein